MIKKLLPIITIISFLLLVSCASNKILSKPEDCTLEFWITDDVTEFDFSDYYFIPGMFGGSMYYGKGYAPTLTDEGYDIRPEYYVIYTLTAYPDYSSKGDFVTDIEITDPAISIYGITCNSSREEFDKVFLDLGCEIEDNGVIHRATYGKTRISFCDYESGRKITISVEVSNRQGIVF